MLTLPMYRMRMHLIGALVLGCLTAQNGQAQGPEARTNTDSSAPWSASQSGWKGRLVVGEFLTGAYCFLCQGHDNNVQ